MDPSADEAKEPLVNLTDAKKSPNRRLSSVAAFDEWISGSLHLWISKLPETRHVFLGFEHSGNGLFVIPLVIFSFVNPWEQSDERRQFWLGMVIGLILDLIVIGFLKNLFRRPRPVYNRDMTVIIAVDHWSFPSGHASRALLLAGLVTMSANIFPATVNIPFLPHDVTVKTITLIQIFDTWAVATAASRILLGRHYFLDVVCGCLMGYLEALVTLRYFWPSLQLAVNLHEHLEPARRAFQGSSSVWTIS